MVDYIRIEGVEKRGFIIPASIPELSETAYSLMDNWIDDTGALMVDDTGEEIVFAHNSVNPIMVNGIEKRGFIIPAKVNT